MRIQGDNQLHRLEFRPEAEVDVIPPDHPAEEKVQALTRPSASWRWQQMMHPVGEVTFTIDRSRVQLQEMFDEGGERRPGVLLSVTVTGKEEGPERPVTLEGLPEKPEQASGIGSGVEAVGEPAQAVRVPSGIETQEKLATAAGRTKRTPCWSWPCSRRPSISRIANTLVRV